MSVDIEELEKWYKATTPGKWERPVDDGTITVEGSTEILTTFRDKDDATFTVEIRDAFPAIVSELKRLRKGVTS